MSALREAHRRAVALFALVLTDIDTQDLGRPTPCEEWDVADLLAHQAGQERGFALAWRGGGGHHADWSPIHEDEPVEGVLERLTEAERALTEVGPLDGVRVWVPEIARDHQIAGTSAVAAHTLDLAVHAWDLTAAMGRTLRVPSSVVAVVAEIAAGIPGGNRQGPGALFGPAVPDPGLASTGRFATALRDVGRDPGWRPQQDGRRSSRG